MDNNTKLYKQGYTIIRKDDQRLVIKRLFPAKTSEGGDPAKTYSWQDYMKGFKSKAALEKEYQLLLNDPKIISG